jgi:serine protease AprX
MVQRLLGALAFLAIAAVSAPASARAADTKLDDVLRQRADVAHGWSRVIIRTRDGSNADALIRSLDGQPGRHLPLLHAQVASLPNASLDALASSSTVLGVSLDRQLDRTGAAVGATWVQETLGLDGSGVGVAIIDSGVASWHDDLGPDRVVRFVDFVDFLPMAYDDYGHGTHVAGIIAGSGYDSGGARRGIAPGASLIVLKVLDEAGEGYISNVIAALDYAVQHRVELNIRVINLSVAAGVYESYDTDPLTLAAKRAVDAGLVVVCASGNFGRNAAGHPQYGGITAPGNAPWVLTVGASSHNGTVARGDDTIAPFSSRGPAAIDYAAKPDLVAPGVGIESITDRSTLLFATHPSARLWGTVQTATQPYLSLTGTSMAAPVVAGTVALMLEANPELSPNLVKAILQYTAEHHAAIDDLTQGAGFLNARGAVQLARALGDRAAPAVISDPTKWNRHINWGNHRVGGGVLKPGASAWRTDVTWGAATTPSGDRISWGSVCAGAGCDGVVWGAEPGTEDPWGAVCSDDACDTVVWGTSENVNIVWGSACDGNDCGNTFWEFVAPEAMAATVGASSCDARTPTCRDVVWPHQTRVRILRRSGH